jgi:hypothetical protein
VWCGVSGLHIYQIYYSQESRRSLDPGFIPLDNLANERPDWREYWPIRRFLLDTRLVETDYYGFFSPKFRAKTHLDAAAVHGFVRGHAPPADVLLFSPFFDQSAFYLNCLENCKVAHASLNEAVWRQCLSLIAPGFNAFGAVMCSANTVFCNYLVAKGAFWSSWLQRCELIFRAAEARSSELAEQLNCVIEHGGGSAPAKVFVMERIASVLLAGERKWTVRAYNPMGMERVEQRFGVELVIMDALKLAYSVQGYEQYLQAFFHLRQTILSRLGLSPRTTAAPSLGAVASAIPDPSGR